MGVVSSIGRNKLEVLDALQAGRSGIEFCQQYADLGLRCHVHGAVHVDLAAEIDRDMAMLGIRSLSELRSSHLRRISP